MIPLNRIKTQRTITAIIKIKGIIKKQFTQDSLNNCHEQWPTVAKDKAGNWERIVTGSMGV